MPDPLNELDAFLMRPLPDQKQGLVDLIDTLPYGIIACEIGSYLGESAQIFIESGKIRALYCIDSWKNGYDPADEASYRCDMSKIENGFNTRLGGYRNIEKVKGRSLEAVHRFRDKFFDLVYIDGMHTYEAVKADILAYLPKIKPGGCIAGHDWGWKGLTDAIVECLGEPDKTFVDGSWVKYQKT